MDLALHHYDTLTVDQISHRVSETSGSQEVIFNALGRTFHLVLSVDKSIFADDFSVHSVDGDGVKLPHEVDKGAFLHGQLKGVVSHLCISSFLSSL